MRFLRYAVGEILLVVVGILIALQVNNWNEQRLEQAEIREYALNLSASIKTDMEMLEPVKVQVRASIRYAEELARYLRDTPIDDLDNTELVFLTVFNGYRPYGWNRAALDQLKSSGGLRKMRNATLVQRVSDYDSLTRHLDQDYQEDNSASRHIWDLVNTLVDTNYEPEGTEDLWEWSDGFTEEDLERRLTRFRETETYARLSAMQRPLLSRDAAAFGLVGNLSLDYALSTRPRYEIEIPRLQELAREIQSLIELEYQ
jgi:hypothetical protein